MSDRWDDSEDYPLVGELSEQLYHSGFHSVHRLQTGRLHWMCLAHKYSSRSYTVPLTAFVRCIHMGQWQQWLRNEGYKPMKVMEFGVRDTNIRWHGPTPHGCERPVGKRISPLILQNTWPGGFAGPAGAEHGRDSRSPRTQRQKYRK